ncbi:hypothetical protein SNE25_08915 [Mucilaginibacter sabulilitoris]|uniref:Uncharacterized protein n=1 Tax=Mucilaginibacter sabulilitoris TaxID=1173583 RepID=A0ABZ0TR85_9SPHI|nr:hypothetical protein [Mucilaginibacter sabulilitoris]WPU95638.1 hypothetical protein SNE25_08915 [Mucilaginibacter sabulilitoris]
MGLCRESPFTAFTSETTFAVTDDQLNPVTTMKNGLIIHRHHRKNQHPLGLAKAKSTLIFTVQIVLYNAQKAQTENLENREISVVTSTIMARAFTTQ